MLIVKKLPSQYTTHNFQQNVIPVRIFCTLICKESSSVTATSCRWFQYSFDHFGRKRIAVLVTSRNFGKKPSKVECSIFQLQLGVHKFFIKTTSNFLLSTSMISFNLTLESRDIIIEFCSSLVVSR